MVANANGNIDESTIKQINQPTKATNQVIPEQVEELNFSQVPDDSLIMTRTLEEPSEISNQKHFQPKKETSNENNKP